MKYADLILMPLEAVRVFVSANPDHIAGGNALRELERAEKDRKVLERIGKKGCARVDGMTKARYSPGLGGRRCPTKRELG